ncbi:MAG: hypothetical protein HGA96_07655 [Desulfobulbaceae bacterium]|nr:hypothetical protein [Desulfobulbaceae bacterium]
MAEKEAFGSPMNQEKRTNWGIWLGGVVLLLVLGAFWWIGGGDQEKTAKIEPKTVAQEMVAISPPVAKIPAATATKPVIPTVTKTPEVKAAQPANQPPPTLGLSLNEFCQRFNKNSERVKSKLRIMNFTLNPGTVQDSYKHVFNENLYLTGVVNKADGDLVQVNLDGVLNGSLATTVDLNLGIGSIITAFIPGLSPEGRESILNTLGINKITSGIYNLEEQVTKNGVTYWVKSTRKDGLHFGVRSARGN